MTTLATPLPDNLAPLADKVTAALKPAAFLAQDPTRPGAPGATRAWGCPDLPTDAAWALAQQAPPNGESFWLQLNLAEIPAEVRKADWPLVGVVWVFIDPAKAWTATTHFDSRPAESIPWQAGNDITWSVADWQLHDTLPCCTRETLPEIWLLGGEPNWMAWNFDDWAFKHYIRDHRRQLQIGGWSWPCLPAADFIQHNQTLVCAMEEMAFGDSGAVYLYFTPERGFYACLGSN